MSIPCVNCVYISDSLFKDDARVIRDVIYKCIPRQHRSFMFGEIEGSVHKRIDPAHEV